MESQYYPILPAKTIKFILHALQPKVREFKKGELILWKETNENRLCLLLKGTAYLCVENEYAAKQLLDFFIKGQIFCHEMMPNPNNGHCFIQAKYPCSVAYLSYQDLMEYISKNSASELSEVFQNIFRTIISARNEHCHMLQQKNIRGKLMAFFHYQRTLQNSRLIHVPIPYSDLADYLTIDRSAMMTELTKMHEEGLIEKNQHTIKL